MRTFLPDAMRQKRMLTLSMMLLVTFCVTAVPAYADTLINLPATPTPQRFSVPDPNGDTGATDCMAAAFSTALLTMYDTGNLGGTRESYTYPTIRQFLRSWAPDLRQGIKPEVLIAATPTVTQREYTLTQERVDPASWESFLRNELAAGRPVIVHMAHRNALYNPASRTAQSHVIVVYGMDQETISFTDSWDGMSHTLSHTWFAAAWSRGYYNWIAFPFSPHS